MSFLKYILELIVIYYILRFAIRAIDGFWNGSSKNDPTDKWQKTNTTNTIHTPQSKDNEYIDYEEVK